MDIKSKKWKSIVSFLAFFLGVSMVFWGAAGLCERFMGYGVGSREEALEQDYQNTAAFRNYMEERFYRFLAMAEGIDLRSYSGRNYSYYNYDIVYGTAVIEETTIQSEAVWEADDFWGPSLDIETGTASGSFTEQPGSGEDYKKEAAEYHNAIQKDKNLLYRISYEGKTLYSNMEENEWRQWGDALPDGYNFLLYFDGKKAEISKNGVEQDIYGDGYYTEDSKWYLPGYKNFTQDEEIENVEIVMFAAEHPMRYSHAIKSGSSGYIQTESGLYYIAKSQERICQGTKAKIACLVPGLCLLVFYLIHRQEKKRVDVWLGRLAGKVWVEVRLLLFLVALMGSWHWYPSEWFFYRDAIILFWLFYLLVNDIRKNRSRFWNGIIRRWVQKLETNTMHLPLAKRMVSRCRPLLYGSLFLCAAAFLLGLCITGRHWPGYMAALTFLCCVVAISAFALIFDKYTSKVREQAAELEQLTKYISAVRSGDYSGKEKPGEYSELKEAAAQLEEIQQGMEQAVEERMKSERMKVELVANVSHDIKTPLTSIISYVEFLKQEEDLPQHVKDYISILNEKSERLKNMVQDVFSISKAASGQLSVELEELDFGKLLRQTLADMSEQIDKTPVTVKTDIPETPVIIRADGQRMYRVFQNLLLNACRYSLEGSRIYITLTTEDGIAFACIKNTSRRELTTDTDFTERFVRGDESRTDGGSGLGLSIAKSFTEACGGRFKIEVIADLFVASVSFPYRIQQ